MTGYSLIDPGFYKTATVYVRVVDRDYFWFRHTLSTMTTWDKKDVLLTEVIKTYLCSSYEIDLILYRAYCVFILLMSYIIPAFNDTRSAIFHMKHIDMF